MGNASNGQFIQELKEVFVTATTLVVIKCTLVYLVRNSISEILKEKNYGTISWKKEPKPSIVWKFWKTRPFKEFNAVQKLLCAIGWRHECECQVDKITICMSKAEITVREHKWCGVARRIKASLYMRPPVQSIRRCSRNTQEVFCAIAKSTERSSRC